MDQEIKTNEQLSDLRETIAAGAYGPEGSHILHREVPGIIGDLIDTRSERDDLLRRIGTVGVLRALEAVRDDPAVAGADEVQRQEITRLLLVVEEALQAQGLSETDIEAIERSARPHERRLTSLLGTQAADLVLRMGKSA